MTIPELVTSIRVKLLASCPQGAVELDHDLLLLQDAVTMQEEAAKGMMTALVAAPAFRSDKFN